MFCQKRRNLAFRCRVVEWALVGEAGSVESHGRATPVLNMREGGKQPNTNTQPYNL